MGGEDSDEEKVKGKLGYELLEEWSTLQANVIKSQKWSVPLGEEGDDEDKKVKRAELQKEKDELLQ